MSVIEKRVFKMDKSVIEKNALLNSQRKPLHGTKHAARKLQEIELRNSSEMKRAFCVGKTLKLIIKQ